MSVTFALIVSCFDSLATAGVACVVGLSRGLLNVPESNVRCPGCLAALFELRHHVDGAISSLRDFNINRPELRPDANRLTLQSPAADFISARANGGGLRKEQVQELFALFRQAKN